ncbi:LacI family DNA-binding transcriptional regulator [Hespellia stercorisuis]|uniref:Transcriptional regulator, LacI family n=1 Tax=Hespellia stercorisuis DSM 15480 TaxID=1121950 RepID=A0A1M6SLE2_9FIRM|nr:LacI family DNA-binding transcriptional regulator [Hespellia stercorisuis]SHK45503.1 transcriptional regulator, LacI family [Hespellia stercorisuis DSM 15480]
MNIYDIAKEAGVSASTVSRVLNGNKNVKKETREKIQKVINGKNYVPNALARNLSVGVSQNIAFLVPDIENPFFGKILHGISDRAKEYNYNIFMFGTDECPDREHQILSSLQIEMMRGLIIIPVSENDSITEEMLENFEEKGVPVILIDRDIMGSKFDGVFSEDEEGSYGAVECLIKEGHKKIATITGPETSRPGHNRLKGYKRALEANGIAIRPEYIICGEFNEEKSYKAMKKLMERKDPPTAIFSCNNMTTLGCLKYLSERDMKLSRDISLVGFDDIRELQYTNIKLSVVSRPVYDMGCEAMELLERRFEAIQNGSKERTVKRRNYVQTSLILRGSEKK